jgi:transcription elongation factor GreB
MSKAFTREDDRPDVTVVPRPASVLPPGAKNYLTSDGAERLRRELNHLVEVKRPGLIANGPASDSPEFQALNHRIQQLQESLASAVVVELPTEPLDRVRFGATVTVREHSGEESSYRIVGVDETDIDRGWVSWISPIAKALMNARVGERVHFKLPGREKELEIVSITYE